MKSIGLVRHSAVYAAGTALVSVTGFVLIPVYTRYLSVAEFGLLEVLSRFGDILNIVLFTNGLRAAAFTFYKQSVTEAERQNVVVTTVTLTWCMALLIGGPVMLMAGWIDHWFGIGNVALLRMALLWTSIDLLMMAPLIFIQARLESVTFVAIHLGQNLLKMALCLFLVVVLGLGIWGILIAWVSASTIFGVCLTLKALSDVPLRTRVASLVEMVRFSVPFLAGGVGFFLLNSGDRFFLLKYADVATVGIYALAYKLALMVGQFTRDPLQRAWSAHMYDVARTPAAPEVFGRAITRIFGAYLFVGVGLSVFQDEAVWILGGRSYIPGSGAIFPLVMAYGCLAVADLLDAGFYVTNRTFYKFWITSASTAVVLALYAILIPLYGVQGAAYSTLLGFAFHAVLTWLLSARVFTIHLEFRRLMAFVVSATAVWLVSREIADIEWSRPARVMLWILWPAALWLTGIVSAEEKRWVVSNFQRALNWFKEDRHPANANTLVPAELETDSSLSEAVLATAGDPVS